ncbi:hypothetical protein PIB30_047337 [Stylosanthes scabra]|uniref:Uncharacterized protein n=1 Tax=Stylosanthes scabra TaxID=79078 RepID=A0ABU6RGS1_9FABA|nr:hypothetical protein [Stylosanthes scabra]
MEERSREEKREFRRGEPTLYMGIKLSLAELDRGHTLYAPAIHAQASRTPHSELTVREPRLGAITTCLGVHITLTHYSSHKQPRLGAITTCLGVPASKPQKSHQQSPTPRRLTPTPSVGDTSCIPKLINNHLSKQFIHA